MYIIHKIINKKFIYKLSIQLINEYLESNRSQISIKYINKFKYIYNKTHEYYYTDKLNINEIAIKNLYIISQIKNKNSLYFLVKYLYKK